jgi:hypothetical protein
VTRVTSPPWGRTVVSTGVLFLRQSTPTTELKVLFRQQQQKTTILRGFLTWFFVSRPQEAGLFVFLFFLREICLPGALAVTTTRHRALPTQPWVSQSS